MALAERAQAEGISVIHLIVAIALCMTDAPRAGSVQRSRLIHLGKSYQRWLKMMDERQSPADILRQIVDDIGYQSFLTDGSEAGLMRWVNVEELIGVAGQHPTVKAFLDHVGRMNDPLQRADGNAVQLMTIHAAKGLEFDTVFLVRCEEGCLPHYRSVGHPDMVQEERRLFYVGVTRAENRLYLSYPASRSFRGGQQEQTPSRFFREIEPALSTPRTPALTR